MVIFHSYVSLPEGKLYKTPWCHIISGTAAPSPSPSTAPNIASGMTKLLQLMKFNTSLGLVLPFKDSEEGIYHQKGRLVQVETETKLV
jgi:hypothetical protein